jgi:zinc transport system substrate-binding protein
MLPRRWIGTAGACALALAVGCRPPEPAGAGAAIRVAVSIVPQAWLVRQIGGEHVRVATLVGPAESPETYQPTDAQVSQVLASQIFFRIGMPFEEGPVFQAIQGRVKMVDLRRGIELRLSEHDVPGATRDSPPGDHAPARGPAGPLGGGHAGPDPHIWSSPRLLRVQAQTVAQSLKELDPPHARQYDRNLRALEERLRQTDQEIRRILGPVEGRAFFVFHPAWGYFADDYRLTQVAIENEGKDPSDRELTELQRLARERKIQVVFVEPQSSSRAARAVARAIGGRVEFLDPLAPDVTENLVRAAAAIAASLR